MNFLRLYRPLLCGLLLTVAPIALGASAKEVGEKSADIDEEIAQLEKKRAAEILFSLQLLSQRKQYARAGELATRALLIPLPTSEKARFAEPIQDAALALLRAEKQPGKALELCERLAECLGDDAISFFIASMACKELGMAAKQNEYQEKAKAIRSEDLPYWFGKDDQAYWFNVGSFFAQRKEEGPALDAFEAAAAVSSDKPTYFNADSEAAMASICCRRGDYEEALRHCNNLQEIARKIVVPRTSMAALTAMVYAEKARESQIEEKYDEAIEDYKRSAEFSPQPGPAYISIGELYLKRENREEAEKWFNRAVAAGGLPMAYAGLGDVRKAQGRNDEAQKEYARCEEAFAEEMKRNPRDAAAYNNFAWFYATHGNEFDRGGKPNLRFAKGMELAKKALELAPNSAEYLDTLAELYYRTGDREGAIREIEKAIALNPPHSKYYHKQLQRFQKEGP